MNGDIHWGVAPVSFTPSSVTEPLSVANDVKPHLRIHASDTSDDTYLTSRVRAAREFAENITRKSLVSRTWDLITDGFCGDQPIRLPYGPVLTITGVYTTSTADTETEFTSSYYYLDTTSTPARVVLKYGNTWPSSLREYKSVRVRYTAGYTNADADNLPPQVIVDSMLQYILLYFDSERDGFVMTKSERYHGIKQQLGAYAEYYADPFTYDEY